MGFVQRAKGLFGRRQQALQPWPGPAQIDELLAYLPCLYPQGVAITTRQAQGAGPWPVYLPVVNEFFAVLASEYWIDHGYSIEAGHALVDDPTAIAQADLALLRRQFTYCCRGERFCDGHWAAMIEQGHVLSLLQRLQQLRQ